MVDGRRENGEEEEQLSPRQLRRRAVKEAGRRSAEASHHLMLLPEQALKRLDLGAELRDAFLAAKAIPNTGARRREERRLAGVLRLGDLDELERMFRRHEEAGRADARLFKQVEAWRTRLLSGGAEALEAFHEEHPGQERRKVDKLVHEAQREDARGKPKGSKKALFRHVAEVLKGTSSAA